MDVGLYPLRGTQAHILIVEDDCANASLLVHMLDLLGHQATCAETGAAALLLLAGGPDWGNGPRPGLILLDLRLPDMDGVELIRRARAGGQPLPPMVVLSASAPDEIAQAAHAIGAMAALRKPFDISTLIDCVTRILAETRYAVPAFPPDLYVY